MYRAKILADSLAPCRQRLTTFEITYPRFVHAEFMTHREFSRNSASSRTIPVEKMIERVERDPATPVWWGKNQSGMQAREELVGEELARVSYLTHDGKRDPRADVELSEKLIGAGT